MDIDRLHKGNEVLINNLYVPKTQKLAFRLKLDQKYPYNENYVNFSEEILTIISNHFHENPGYTYPAGNLAARQYLAQLYGVQPSDVFLAPTMSQAHWYLLNIFLDSGDSVACNEGLKPDLLKVKIDTDYRVASLTDVEQSKLVFVRNPDIDSDLLDPAITDWIRNLKTAEKGFLLPKAFVSEEPYSLYMDNNPMSSARSIEMPEQTPVYLLASLNELLLNEDSGFAIIVLLNNANKRFDQLNIALKHLSRFYNPPNTAIHPLISKILPLLDYKSAIRNYELIEERKAALIDLMTTKGVKAKKTPHLVFSIGVKRSPKLIDMIETGQLLLPRSELLRDESAYVYVSVLYPDSVFHALIDALLEDAGMLDICP